MLVPVSETLSEVFKAASVDPDAADELIRLGLYEALCDLVDANARSLQRDLGASVTKRSHELRRGLVRTYLDRRMTGRDVDDVLKAASVLETVGKAKARQDDPETPWWDARDEGGRFTSRVTDVLGQLTTQNEGLQQGASNTRQALQGDKYSRMRVLGNALVQTGNPTAQQAGTLARVAAELGPEAERVLGPGMRRTAYRYRGTERRPDQQLRTETKQVNTMIALQSDTGNPEQAARFRELHANQSAASQGGELATGVGGYYASRNRQGLTSDQKRMRAVGDTAVGYLIPQVPSIEDARLSWEAGQTPPSVGVMIDRDGDVVSEAMGFNGDNYLPFDLKNLKRLHGGQYVRTRALGGPTSEDIYTALMTGARQLQVVSNSGVFTVEFDPDLRGGRRYSDKARQMVNRYGAILDRIEQSGAGGAAAIYTPDRDIPPAQRREIRQQVINAAIASGDVDEDVINRRVKTKIQEARLKASVGMDEDEMAEAANERVNAWASRLRERGRNVTPADMKARRLEELTDMRENQEAATVRRLQLDGEGYDRALRALQREFPYYIRPNVKYETLPDFLESRNLHERGSGPLPKRNAPEASRSHVSRGNILSAGDAAGRRLDVSGQRLEPKKKGKPDEAAESAGGEDTTTTAGKTPAAAPKRAAAIDSDTAIQQLAPVFSVGAVTNRLVSDIAQPTDENNRIFTDPEQAAGYGSDSLVAWLHRPDNPQTHGNPALVTRFLMHANENVLRQAAEGYDLLADYIPSVTPKVPQTADQAQNAADTVRMIADVRFPFGEGEANANYTPDFQDPRPAKFGDISSLLGADDETFRDFANKQAKGKDSVAWDRAMEELSQYSGDEQIGNALRSRIANLNAHRDRMDPEDAKKEEGQLLQLQRAWAFLKAKRVTADMRKLGGESGGPKEITSKRLLLVVPDSPVGKALARSLADRVQARASSR